MSNGLDSKYDVNRQARALALVSAYIDNHLEKTDPKPDYQVYVVWFTYILGNWKALVSSTLPDGKYYEVTYNWAKRESYIDCYLKVDNIKIEDEIVYPKTDNGQEELNFLNLRDKLVA